MEDERPKPLPPFIDGVVEHVLQHQLYKDGTNRLGTIVYIAHLEVTYMDNRDQSRNKADVKHSQGVVINQEVDYVGSIKIHAEKLREEGQQDLATIIASLSEAISKSSMPDKAQHLQNLDLLGGEAAKPEAERNKPLLGFLVKNFDKVLPAVEGISKIWDKLKDFFPGNGN